MNYFKGLKMKPKIYIVGLFFLLFNINVPAPTKHAPESRYMTYKGLVMAGYQGWFNCEGDAAGRGWTHYNKNGKFEDGSYTILGAWTTANIIGLMKLTKELPS